MKSIFKIVWFNFTIIETYKKRIIMIDYAFCRYFVNA